MRIGTALGTLAVVSAAASYCALHAWDAPARPLGGVLIEGVPHVRQKPDFCGEACAAMFLRKLGKDFDQDDVFNASGLDPALGRGVHTKELAVALERIGFRIGEVGFSAKLGPRAADEQWRALHLDLTRGTPSIVRMRYDESPNASEHFRLVLGYDEAKDEVIYHEPAKDAGAHLRMKRSRFLALWPLEARGDRRRIVRLRLEPGKLLERPVDRREGRYSDADYAQHVKGLQEKRPQGFTIVVEKPFVVLGDEAPDTVRRRAVGIVRWATNLLKQAYFEKDPEEILDIWLLKDASSYEAHSASLFGIRPTTPYGYFSSTHRALVMNIYTGGGTLVHEIVHPFVEANFPECPSWFNEGLGSLYEQSAEKGGKIVGRTNWRLRGLAKTIRAGGLQSFRELASMSSGEFYGGSRGDNYAQARYLLYYLQEEGLLRRYYRLFHADRKADPTGYETLEKLLGEPDMEKFQRRWEAWVLTLRYP